MSTLALKLTDIENDDTKKSDAAVAKKNATPSVKETDVLHEKPVVVRPISFEGQIAFRVNACKYIP